MNDALKAKFFRELNGLELFQAQTSLENETLQALVSRLLTIDLARADLQLEYARLRGQVDALKQLKATRERLIEEARSRNPNS